MNLAPRWGQSRGEEVANAISHGVGLLVAAIGAPILTYVACRHGSRPFLIGSVIFAATIALLYFSSTLYHSWPPTRFKAALQVIDHSAIFLLIAGTYTPFLLGPLHGAQGWGLLVCIWLAAAAGVALKVIKGVNHRPRIAVALYLAMGWLVLLVIRPLARALPVESMWWLVAGGLFYTVGVYFFARDHHRYRHFIWHVFVLGGTASHYFAVLTYAT